MLTRPIPAKALRVVELIRERVPCPDGLPESWSGMDEHDLRWTEGKHAGCCPMGMDDSTGEDCPIEIYDFDDGSPYIELGNAPIESFWGWWDEQVDAQAAVDAVWNTPC